jgi:hypothetical protein
MPCYHACIRYLIATLLFLALAIARLIPTYKIFNQTYDEPAHIACGMEWLDQGTYAYERMHPPLARVAVALGPYLIGQRAQHELDAYAEGNAILFSGDYWRTLAAARLGTLPFLAIAAITIFLWGRRWFSEATGFWAAALFLSLPPILGHAGLATIDVACVAGVVVALYYLMRFFEDPGWRRAIVLAAALSFAILTKFSAPVFVIAASLCFFWQRPKGPRTALKYWAAAAGVMLVLLWAGYRFNLAPSPLEEGSRAKIESYLPAPVRGAVYTIVDLPLPLTDLLRGAGAVYLKQKTGHESYLFGHARDHGWWYFFPVVLAVKTPIPFLLLAAVGVAIGLRERRVTALIPVAILLVCMTSSIDLGVRHILPIYPFLALLAGHAVVSARRGFAIAALVLVAWTIAESWIAHPDYLAYFNEFAGRHPEKILVDSDLDWGQDLHRLSVRLKELGVGQFSLAYFGTALPARLDLPPATGVPTDGPVSGYVAISARALYLNHAELGHYDWLMREQPFERVGRSIFLYRIP